ncbi:MAG: hypothetical protein CBD12_003130 [Amoebophilaceae bacterium TMED152]|nr:MAG: hypothetical protein CBD12_003130 [Amoebophilaceae bacterium TMED152]
MVAKFSASKYLSYSTLYASSVISCIEEKKYIKQARMTTKASSSFGFIKDSDRRRRPRTTWDRRSHDLLKPSNL